MRRLLAAALAVLAFAGGAQGAPALWKVTGTHATVYLFGSVHILPPSLRWRDARIGKAIDEADSFFFETALDKAPVQKTIAEKGSLPAGQSLRAMLPPESQKDLDPAARKILFDDRDAAWVKTLEGVLDSESGTVLVTVGAGHLLGEQGVPALLKRDGYKVERV